MKTAAKYNKVIEFIISNEISDGMGGSNSAYSLLFIEYANIVPKTEKRGLQEGQLVLVGYFDVSLRFRRDIPIEKTLILKHEDQYYTINSIINYQDKEYQLVCTSNDLIQDIFLNDNRNKLPAKLPVILV